MKILTIKTIKSLSIVVLFLTLALPGWAEERTPFTTPSGSPPPRFGHTMVNINGNVYLFGGMQLGGVQQGQGSPIMNDLWKYYPGALDWAEIVAADPPPARHSHTATVVGGKMYVYGGMNGAGQPMNDTWHYAAHTWSQVLAADPPPARAFHGTAAVGDKLVTVGGIGPTGSPSNETWIYDTVGSSWTQGQDFPGPGYAYAESMASGNGKAYVTGHTQGLLYEYDVALDTWTTIPTTGGALSTITAAGDAGGPAPRALALSAQQGDTVWLAGGEDLITGDVLDDVWELNLETATWTQRPDLPEPLAHSAMVVLDGSSAQTRRGATANGVRLLIFGGVNNQGQVNENQYVYEPWWSTYLPLVVRH